jgi:WD40 repeat protein
MHRAVSDRTALAAGWEAMSSGSVCRSCSGSKASIIVLTSKRFLDFRNPEPRCGDTKSSRSISKAVLPLLFILLACLYSSGQELIVNNGGGDNVTIIATSPAGELLATAQAATKKIVLWDLHSGRQLRVLEPTYETTSLRFTLSGDQLVIGTVASTVELFDCSTGGLIKELQLPLLAPSNLRQLKIPIHISSIDANGLNQVNNVLTPVISLPEYSKYQRGMITNKSFPVAVSDKGLIAAATPASQSKTNAEWIDPSGVEWYVTLWTAGLKASGQLRPFDRSERDGAPIKAMDFAPGGHVLALLRTDGIVELWDIDKRTQTKYATGNDKASGISFAPDGSGLLLYGQTTTLLHLESALIDQLPATEWALWLPSESSILLAQGGALSFIDPLSLHVTHHLDVGQSGAHVAQMAPLPDNNVVLTIDGRLFLFDLARLKLHHICDDPAAPSHVVGIEPGSEDHLLVSDGGLLRRWNLKSGKLLPGAYQTAGIVKSIKSSSDGESFVAGSSAFPLGTAFEVFDVHSQKSHKFVQIGSFLSLNAISPDFKRAATFDRSNGNVTVLDAETGSNSVTFKIAQDATATVSSASELHLPTAISVAALTFLSQTTLAVLGQTNVQFENGESTGGDLTLYLWDVKTGANIFFQAIHGEDMRNLVLMFTSFQIAVSPSGGDIGFANGVPIHIWNSISRRERQFSNASASVLTFSQDGSKLAAGDQFGNLTVWDVASGEKLGDARTGPGAISQIVFRNQNSLIVSGDDGVQLWDLSPLQKRATLFFAGDKCLAITPDNYYFGSNEVFDFLSFRVGERAYAIDQFDMQFNRPDKVLHALGSSDEALVTTYATLYERRLKKSGVGAVSQVTSVPDLRIVGDVPLTATERTLILSIDARDSATDLDSLRVADNGVPVPFQAETVSGALGTRTYTARIRFNLENGVNRLELSALNKQKTESFRQSSEVILEASDQQPHLVIISVGVSNYKDSRFRLNYPAKDAADLVTEIAAGWKSQLLAASVQPLIDKTATREALMGLKQGVLAKTGEDDVVVMFLAGHGLTDANGTYYYAPYDMDFARPQAEGINLESLLSLFDGIPARRRVLLLDTCDVGGVQFQLPPEMHVVERSPGVEISAAMTPAARTAELSDEFRDLRRGNGTAVIGAASAWQTAAETSSLGNGFLTYSLLKAISRTQQWWMQADFDHDGTVSLGELKEYLLQSVKALSGGAQTPVIQMGSGKYDFPVFTGSAAATSTSAIGGNRDE